MPLNATHGPSPLRRKTAEAEGGRWVSVGRVPAGADVPAKAVGTAKVKGADEPLDALRDPRTVAPWARGRSR